MIQESLILNHLQILMHPESPLNPIKVQSSSREVRCLQIF